jgi:hypothetical protein
MRAWLRRLLDLVRMVGMGRVTEVWRAVRLRFYSDCTSLGLRRDLTEDVPTPNAQLPIHVRPLAPGDDLSCLDLDQPNLSDRQVFARLGQQRILQSGLRTCYVAVGPDGKPCFMEWLIGASENRRVRKAFGNLYPRLAHDEALLEWAFIPDALARQGVMENAVAQIAARAADSGARWVVTFVQEDHTPAVKACELAGFHPYMRRVEQYRLFRRRIAFKPLSDTAS